MKFHFIMIQFWIENVWLIARVELGKQITKINLLAFQILNWNQSIGNVKKKF
jgi:hypothetical protein